MTLQILSAPPEYTTDLTRQDAIKWSGTEPLPPVGAEVDIRLNRIGRSIVVNYGVSDGYLGVMVYPLSPPDWWIAQNGTPSPETAALAFGCEISFPAEKA